FQQGPCPLLDEPLQRTPTCDMDLRDERPVVRPQPSQRIMQQVNTLVGMPTPQIEKTIGRRLPDRGHPPGRQVPRARQERVGMPGNPSCVGYQLDTVGVPMPDPRRYQGNNVPDNGNPPEAPNIA